jgi:hypothetical protein
MRKGQSNKTSTKVVRTTVAAKVSHASVVAAAPTQEEIARRAYEIYEREGCPAGRDLEHWAQAESELSVSA